MEKSCIYNTVAMSNQFAMQKSHIYSANSHEYFKVIDRKKQGLSPLLPYTLQIQVDQYYGVD